MDVSLAKAANAYASRMKAEVDGTEDEAAGTGGAPGGSFIDELSHFVQDAAATQNKAEQLQMQSVTTGKVDSAELVTAVAQAELSLTTVVAIRDRVIQAYQSIISMAI